MTPDALAALHACCFTTPRPWSAAEFADLVARPDTFLLTVGGGFLLGRVVAGEAELLTVAVDPARRGIGVGAGLVAAFLAEARARGADTAFLEVAEDNAAARATYARAGFHQAGRRRAYYRHPSGAAVDALVLTHPLGAQK